MAAGTANARGARAGGLGLVVSWLPPSPAYNQPPQLAPIPNNPQLAPSRLRGASWQPAQKMRGPRWCERASWQLVATRTSWQLDPPASSQLAPPPQLAARWLELLCSVLFACACCVCCLQLTDAGQRWLAIGLIIRRHRQKVIRGFIYL